MPITRRQFDLGVDDAIEERMRDVCSFLGNHRSEAYRFREMEQALAIIGPGDRRTLKASLLTLERVGAIQQRKVRPGSYSAFWHEVDAETWEARITEVAS